MLEFLRDIDSRLYERYLTLERNIKAGANSFYDAFLDLQEHLLKLIVRDAKIEIGNHDNCGAILRNHEVGVYIKDILKIDEYTYEKMRDYTQKVNHHSHSLEKTIQIETIINYLRVFYNAAFAYAESKSVKPCTFDASYYIEIFGIFEKENAALRREVESLRNELGAIAEEGELVGGELAAYRSILPEAQLDQLSLEEQNAELRAQISILKDIKLSSLEEKLDRAQAMILALQESVIENRAVAYAVGDSICGHERFADYVSRAREDIKSGE